MMRFADTKKYLLWCRTSRRIKWRFAEYGGSYDSILDALKAALEHYKQDYFEYQILNWDDDTVAQGECNLIAED